MEAIVAQLRIKTAKLHQVPRSLLDMKPSPGMLVLVFRKNTQRWEGPFELEKVEGKTAFIRVKDNKVQEFSVTKVKPLYVSDIEGDEQLQNNEDERNEQIPLAELFYARGFAPHEMTEELLENFRPAIEKEMSGLFSKRSSQ